MNVHIRHSPPATTQAAEGLPRRKWSVAEIEAMLQAGIIDEHERFELIGGEIVPMSSKGVPNETIKMELNRFWSRIVPLDINLITETTFRFTEHDFVEPDFLFWPRSVGLGTLKPADVMLAVEVSDQSLAGTSAGRPAFMQAWDCPSIGSSTRERWSPRYTASRVRRVLRRSPKLPTRAC